MPGRQRHAVPKGGRVAARFNFLTHYAVIFSSMSPTNRRQSSRNSCRIWEIRPGVTLKRLAKTFVRSFCAMTRIIRRSRAGRVLHQARKSSRNAASLKISRDEELLRRRIVFHVQHVGLAADLTILNIGLPASRRIIDRSDIPLTTSRALKTSFHAEVPRHTLPL